MKSMLKNKKRRIKNREINNLILQFLSNNSGVAKKKDLIESLGKHVSLVTIYRGINRLLRKGEIISFQVEKDHYLALFKKDSKKILLFAFLICEKCRNVYRLELDKKDIENIAQAIEALYNFKSEFVILEFRGICNQCSVYTKTAVS